MWTCLFSFTLLAATIATASAHTNSQLVPKSHGDAAQFHHNVSRQPPPAPLSQPAEDKHVVHPRPPRPVHVRPSPQTARPPPSVRPRPVVPGQPNSIGQSGPQIVTPPATGADASQDNIDIDVPADSRFGNYQNPPSSGHSQSYVHGSQDAQMLSGPTSTNSNYNGAKDQSMPGDQSNRAYRGTTRSPMVG